MDDPNPTRKDNGAESRSVDTVILTYDRGRDLLDIGGRAASIDLMLDMLGRATRTLEAKLRVQNALQLQQEMAEQARAQAIAASVRGCRA
jgi:hypothetical protein